MQRTVRPAIWVALGVVVALALSVGAFAIAGDTIGRPITPVVVTSSDSPPPEATPKPNKTPNASPSEDPKPSRSATRSPEDDEPTQTSSSSSSEPGDDDHSGDDEHEGDDD